MVAKGAVFTEEEARNVVDLYATKAYIRHADRGRESGLSLATLRRGFVASLMTQRFVAAYEDLGDTDWDQYARLVEAHLDAVEGYARAAATRSGGSLTKRELDHRAHLAAVLTGRALLASHDRMTAGDFGG